MQKFIAHVVIPSSIPGNPGLSGFLVRKEPSPFSLNTSTRPVYDIDMDPSKALKILNEEREGVEKDLKHMTDGGMAIHWMPHYDAVSNAASDVLNHEHAHAGEVGINRVTVTTVSDPSDPSQNADAAENERWESDQADKRDRERTRAILDVTEARLNRDDMSKEQRNMSLETGVNAPVHAEPAAAAFSTDVPEGVVKAINRICQNQAMHARLEILIDSLEANIGSIDMAWLVSSELKRAGLATDADIDELHGRAVGAIDPQP